MWMLPLYLHVNQNSDYDMMTSKVSDKMAYAGLLVAHFENIGFYTGSSSSKYRLFTGFSIKNIG